MHKTKGMNDTKSHPDRVRITQKLLEELTARLHPKPYQETLGLPDSRMGFVKALEYAFSILRVDEETRPCVKSCLKICTAYLKTLQLDQIPIIEVRKRHIKLLLTHIQEDRKFSNRSWNSYRSYLMMLFTELDELEIVDHNPAKEVKKKDEAISYRDTLSIHDRQRVKLHLERTQPVFYRFIQIFFHSGTRRNEIMKLRIQDLDLNEGFYKVWTKKGKKRQVKKVIKTIALPFWRAQVEGYPTHYYVFGKGLLPGPSPIRPEQVTRRWKRHVKDKLGLNVDLYSLKHLNTDETAALLSLQDAARHNSHTTDVITRKHYAFGEQDRQNERLRNLDNPL